MRASSPAASLMSTVVAIGCAVVHLVDSPSVSLGASPPAPAKAKPAAPSAKKGRADFVPINVPPFVLGDGHTTVKPHSAAKGGALKLQKAIADQLSKLDPRPPARLAHFRHLVQGDTVCVGWGADIVSVTPNGTGMLVKIRVHPQLVNPRGLVIPSDSVDETYHYSDGAFRYVGGEVSPGVIPGVINTL